MAQREEELIAVIAHSPRLPQYVHRLTSLLADEAQRREAFYAQVSEGDKAEFINGDVIFHSPAKFRHIAAVKRLLVLMDAYVQGKRLGYVGMEKMMVSLTRNDYEPDICYFGVEKAAGFVPDQTRFPAPDLIVEVLSESTEANDRGVKFDDYAAHGVTEYWIVDPIAETVEQYRLQGDAYALAIKAKSGDLDSTVIDGRDPCAGHLRRGDPASDSAAPAGGRAIGLISCPFPHIEGDRGDEQADSAAQDQRSPAFAFPVN